MHHFFVSPEQIGEDSITVTGPDVNHIRNVLRMQPGDEVGICTGEDDRDFRCRIETLGQDHITLRILWVEQAKAELPCSIWLFQGLPKSDKMEMIIQKAVELGAARIVPVRMHRSVVQLSESKAQAKEKRWNAISLSAAKQCKRQLVPQIGPVLDFDKALEAARELDVLLLPYERAEGMAYTRKVLSKIRPAQSVGIFIGPEGGFEDTEVQKLAAAGAFTVTLGRRILRTETAPLTILSMLALLLEDYEDGNIL